MAKEDIILRSEVHEPLVTKGSALTFEDTDNNWVNAYEQFVLLSQSAQVPAWINLITYAPGKYVMYLGQLYINRSGVPSVGITPGTPPAALVWFPKYATDMIEEPIGVKKFEIVIPAGEVKFMGTGDTPIVIVPKSGVDIVNELIHSSITVDFDEGSPGSTPWNTNTDVYLGYNAMGARLFEAVEILKAEAKISIPFAVNTPAFDVLNSTLRPNKDIVAYVGNGNPLGGDTPIVIRGLYKSFYI